MPSIALATRREYRVNARAWLIPLLAVLVPAAGACRRSEEGVGNATHDSSGVRIVVSGAPNSPDACDALTVEGPPLLRIGGSNANGPHEFFRAVASRRLHDGRIAVLNRGTSEVRFFDSLGTHLGTFGRRGSGPGEFDQPTFLDRGAFDSIVVFESAGQRLTVLDGMGRGARLVVLPQAPQGAMAVGRLSDGTLLLAAAGALQANVETGVPLRDTVRLIRVAAGRAPDTLGTFPGGEFVARDFTQGFVGRGFTSVPFGRSTYFAAAGGLVYVGDNASYSILVHDEGGRLGRIVRVNAAPIPLTDADVAAERARQATEAVNPTFLAGLEERFRRDRIPSTRPAFSRLVVDVRSWLWVRRYVAAADTVALWDVFDEIGRRRCTVRLPPRFRVDEVGADYVLGVGRDHSDVEQLLAYRLRRAPL